MIIVNRYRFKMHLVNWFMVAGVDDWMKHEFLFDNEQILFNEHDRLADEQVFDKQASIDVSIEHDFSLSILNVLHVSCFKFDFLKNFTKSNLFSSSGCIEFLSNSSFCLLSMLCIILNINLDAFHHKIQSSTKLLQSIDLINN